MLTLNVSTTVRKIVTEYCTEMNQSTLCSLASCKLNSNSDCFALETLSKLLKCAKGTTMDYNGAHTTNDCTCFLVILNILLSLFLA